MMPSHMLLSLLAAFNVALVSESATIEVANLWLHHEMEPHELSHHFGVDSAHQVDPEMYQVIRVNLEENDISKRSSGGISGDHAISIEAFGEKHKILLEKNSQLMSESAKVFLATRSGLEELGRPNNTDCHYLHSSDQASAALSNCQGKEAYTGHVLKAGHIFELKPLNSRVHGVLGKFHKLEEDSAWHIITRRPITDLPEFGQEKSMDLGIKELAPKAAVRKRSSKELTVETALFLDHHAYRMFARYFNQNDEEVTNLMLTFMNGIQSIYNFKSLGRRVNFVLVQLELQSTAQFNDHRGDGYKLLDDFCAYQGSRNTADDADKNHWDVGLYLSGLDFFSGSSYITMGLAPVSGICDETYNCVIGEIGVSNQAGKPYPSAGFTSIFVMAHEIGHNLGMHHDDNEGCDKDGYIMSPSRGTKGEVEWSRCSANAMSKLDKACLNDDAVAKAEWDHMKRFDNMPGLKWSSDAQCAFLLRDPEAKTDHTDKDLHAICERLYCKSPTKTGYYAAGPALEGTRCGKGMVCAEGRCRNSNVPQEGEAKWGPWSEFGPCRHGCLTSSQGYQERFRKCQGSSIGGCHGNAVEVRTCSDSGSQCPALLSPREFASKACRNFMEKNTRLSMSLVAEGRQLEHTSSRPSDACTIYCKQVRSDEYLSPQPYFSEADGIDLYFPDGTLCHNDGSQNYYCLKHDCIPADQSRVPRADVKQDVHIYQNAKPDDGESIVDQDTLDYFSVDESGKPKNEAPPKGGKGTHDDDDEFEMDDLVQKVKKRSARTARVLQDQHKRSSAKAQGDQGSTRHLDKEYRFIGVGDDEDVEFEQLEIQMDRQFQKRNQLH